MFAYNKADRLLHTLSQVIARVNRTYVPVKEDDSHTNLAFEALTNRIVGRWINTPHGNVVLTLFLPNLDFEWLDANYNLIDSVPSVCKTIEEIDQEMIRVLLKLGLGPEGFSETMHYEIPVYNHTDKLIPTLGLDATNDWIYYRKLANRASEMLLHKINSQEEIRIWPHHFDTGIYIIGDNKIGIGFGLAMQDSLAGEPYFYFAGYTTNGKSINYNRLPELQNGRWEIGEHWKGAILPISMIDKDSETEASASLSNFIEVLLSWYGLQ